MNALLVMRARLLECNPLVLKCIIRTLQSPQEDPEGISLIIRLLPTEKKLLQTLAEDLLSPECISALSDPGQRKRLKGLGRMLFFRWSWASDVFRQVLTDLNPAHLQDDHAGNKIEAFDMATTLMQQRINKNTKDKRFIRTSQFLQDNQEFFSRLHTVDRETINAVPHPEDEETWCLLALLFRENFDEMSSWDGFKAVAEYIRYKAPEKENPTTSLDEMLLPETVEDLIRAEDIEDEEEMEISDEEQEIEYTQQELMEEKVNRDVDGLFDIANVWDVWVFFRMVKLLHRRPDNSQQMEKLYASPKFKESWSEARIFETDEEDSPYFLGFFEKVPYEEELLHDLMDFFDENILQHVTLKYRQRSHIMSLADPSQFLEFIPWEELSDAPNPALLEASLSELSLDYSSRSGSAVIYKIWKSGPAIKELEVTHCLYLHDDMYFLQEGGVTLLPYSFLADKMLYRCTPLPNTQICADLRNFWLTWNDCALTEDPQDGKIYLMETLPGVKARELENVYGENAAESFFSFLLTKQSEPDQSQMVRELLGDTYNSSYENFLRYIQPNDISMHEQQPIGTGSFGMVYRAIWIKKPQKKGLFNATGPGDVALKLAYDRTGEGSNRNSKFFEELRIAYRALSGNSGSFVRFFGFTRMHVDVGNNLYSQPMPDTSAVFLLVFEYASERTVLDYLKKHMKPGKAISNWESICYALGSVVGGIKTIHRKNVIHRDIHPNNILVQYEYFTNSSSAQYTCMLSDLGEGKTILSSYNEEDNQPTLSSTIPSIPSHSFGVREYQAPEVISAREYTKASDMYALGQLGVDLIKLNYDLLRDSPDEPVKLPLKLMQILEICLDHDPTERYEAELVEAMLEEVTDNLLSGKVEWVVEYELPRAVTGASRYLSALPQS